MENTDNSRWIDLLEEEDLSFVKRFILFSGSLKELATAYNVTYPTLRLRLDRLIAKIKVFDSQKIEDDYERLLRGLFAEGSMEAASFKQLLQAYKQQQRKETHETNA